MNNLTCEAKEAKRQRVTELRQLLGEKFAGSVPAGFAAPTCDQKQQRIDSNARSEWAGSECEQLAHHLQPSVCVSTSEESVRLSGISALDQLGIPRGAISEFAVPPPGAGCGMVISALVAEAVFGGDPLALIDPGDCFDVHALPRRRCSDRFLWVRCNQQAPAAVRERGKSQDKRRNGRVPKALRIADLLLRDGNLPTVIVDLQPCQPHELQGIPNSTWFRLRNLAESSNVRCLFLTPRPMVSSAALRIDGMQRGLTLDALDHSQSELRDRFRIDVLRDRRPRKATETTTLPAAESLQAVG